MDQRMTNYFGTVARATANLSYANRRKVGAVAVCNGKYIIATAFNGTPPGKSNVCEDKDGNTLPSVVHAEMNLLDQVGDVDIVTSIFVTKEPCRACATRLLQQLPHLHTVVYSESSRSNPDDGLALLRLDGVSVHQYVF